MQPDGKIVAAGIIGLGNNVYNFALARYNTDGSLDTTFDTDGKATTAINSIDDRIYAIALQPDGKIVVAGFTYTGSSYDFALARYNNDGSLDTTFDGDGKVTTAFGTSADQAFAVALQPDGKIVAAGTAVIAGNSFDFAVARYNTDGSLDTTFDNDGKVTTNFGTGRDEANAVAIQPDGKIVAAGNALISGIAGDFALARYNIDGSLDTTFDSDGKVTTAFSTGIDEAFAVAIQSNGKIVAAGLASVGSRTDFALARYNTDGSLDTTFGNGGKVITDVTTTFYDEIYAMLIQPDGKIVVAGRVGDGSPTNFVLARYIGDDNGLPTPTPTPTPNLEADVAARPNGDGAIQSDDVVQIRRFLNGTHIPDPMTNEFQRADSFPYESKGDGVLNSADVVQTRRYQNGTSPLQTAGGPLQPNGLQNLTDESNKTEDESKSIKGNPREVRVESTSGSGGETVTVNIMVNAVGDESEYGFILDYEEGVLSNPVIRAGTTGASVHSCNTTAKPGQISCSVGGFAANNTKSTDSGIGEIGAGSNQILISVTFTVAADAAGDTPLTLSDVNTSSDAPHLFTPRATGGMVTILAPSAARVSISDRVWQTNRRQVITIL